jgi:hypothetical protein
MQEAEESFDDVLDDLLAEDGTSVPSFPAEDEPRANGADRPQWMMDGLDDDRHGAVTALAVSACGSLLVCATRVGTISTFGCLA